MAADELLKGNCTEKAEFLRREEEIAVNGTGAKNQSLAVKMEKGNFTH